MLGARNRLRKTFEDRRDQGADGGRLLYVYGCAAHYLNLVEKEVSPRTVLSKVVEVQKYFRNHHLPQAWLREKGGLSPQIPNDTRWNSQEACIDTFLKNYQKYFEISCEHPDEIDKNIISTVRNASIQMETMNLIQQLKLVSIALNTFQSDHCTLGESVKVWLDLQEAPVLQPFQELIKKRFQQCVTPIHFVAYQAHPKYKGKQLSINQENVATVWLTSINENFVAPLMALSIEDEAAYPKSMLAAKVTGTFSPTKWWKVMEVKAEKISGPVTPQCCKFMQEISSLPASSASVERIFSIFGQVHTKLRNRLGNEKTAKLVRCNRMLNGEPEDW